MHTLSLGSQPILSDPNPTSPLGVKAMASLEERVTAPTGEAKVDWLEDNGQLDGATEFNSGSTMAEPEYDVEVKLVDQNSPLYSIKSFEELGLYDIPSCEIL